MAPRYRIRFSLAADRHIEQIFDYIRKDSPEAADRILRDILAAIETLRDLPHLYPVLQDTKRYGRDMRSFPVGRYLVRYRLTTRTGS